MTDVNGTAIEEEILTIVKGAGPIPDLAAYVRQKLRELGEEIKETSKWHSFYSNGVRIDEEYSDRIDAAVRRLTGEG